MPPSAGRGLGIDRRDRILRTTLTLSGELDIETVPQLDRAVRECLHEGVRVIDLDLTGLVFCDLRGLTGFIDASWCAFAAGGRLRLENPPRVVERLLTLTGTRHLVTVLRSGGARGRPTTAVPPFPAQPQGDVHR
ncbi:STAS domain-containing protein [Kitasatospora sp. NBC_00070]|uniref:STAS domain-containing protein n=1 Tax=Kitasatospora sp. NBC_00070 TaxID=2975962 RepID=UPI0032567EDF